MLCRFKTERTSSLANYANIEISKDDIAMQNRIIALINERKEEMLSNLVEIFENIGRGTQNSEITLKKEYLNDTYVEDLCTQK